jgi:5'-3' exonuclease
MLLLVDGTNQFIRTYVSFSTTTTNGAPFGGVFGFLCALNSFVNLTNPSRVIIVFDAPGGSQQRRNIYKEYKAGRKPARLNRQFDIGAEEERENKKAQEQYLREYLRDLPVSTICIPNIEADDVLAYLCLMNPNERKVIVSSDRDFHQLLDANTIIYKPTKQELYTQLTLVEETKIYPINFGLARAFTGDSSDNIKGIPMVGLKRLVDWIPLFREKRALTAAEIFAFCEQQEHKRYRSFEEHKARVLDNYSIMQLRDPVISLASVSQIKASINPHPSMNSTSFRMKLVRDGLDLGEKFLCNFLKLSLAGKTNHV